MANERNRRNQSTHAVRRGGPRRIREDGAPIDRRGERSPRFNIGSAGPLGAIAAVALVAFGALSGFEEFESFEDFGLGQPESSVIELAEEAAAQKRPGSGETAPETIAAADQPFDYYVLALSWSPAFCRENPTADQCGAGRRFIVHGLWPQFERGWPQDCDTPFAPPNNALLERYAALTGDADLLAYQWRKHGSCSGLSPAEYFATAAAARESVATPSAFSSLEETREIDVRALETAFITADPRLDRDGITIRCSGGAFTEVRICLTPDLQPRACAPDVRRDCSARGLDVFAPR